MPPVDLTPEDDRPKVRPPRDEGPHVAGPGESDAFAFADGSPSAVDALDAGDVPETRPDQVRGVLRAIGRGTHALMGDERFPEHWSFTEPELDDLTAPVTALVNQSEYLRRAVHRSDYLTIAVALFGWTDRNLALQRMIAEAEAEPETAELPDEFDTDADRRPPVMDLGALDSLVRP